MSHFLGRLVERALGIATPVEPVVPSRFAPEARPADGLSTPWNDAPALSRPAPTPEPAAARRRGSPDGERPAPRGEEAHALPSPPAAVSLPARAPALEPEAARAPELAQVRSVREAGGPPAVVERMAGSALAAAPLGDERPRSPASTSETSQKLDPVSETPLHDPAGRVALVDRLDAPSRRAVALRPPPDQDAGVRAPLAATTQSSAPGAPRPVTSPRAEGAPTPPLVAEAPQAAPVRRAFVGEQRSLDTPPAPRPAPAGASSRAETADRAPSIRVTIGRIEVRAVVAPPPARPPAPKPAVPRLTLDEYLEREGGRS